MFCSPEQRKELQEIHADSSTRLTHRTFAPSASSQATAREFLRSASVDKESLEMLESKWSTVWKTSWTTKDGGKTRILYQW